MKILYLITKAERGGAQQHVRDLAIAFFHSSAGGRYQVTVAIGEPSGWLYDELHREGIVTKYVPLKRGWNPFSFFTFAIHLSRLIWHTQPDIVHFHSSHTLLGAWIVKLFFYPAKSVITLHGLSLLADNSATGGVPHLRRGFGGQARPRFQSFLKWIYKIYISLSLRSADEVICVCAADAVIIKKMFTSVSLHVIHNGIDAPKFSSRIDARKQLGLSPDDFVIGTLGRLAYPKNQEMLLNAFSKIQNRQAVLCLIGEGFNHDRLVLQATELGVRNLVVFAHGDATLLSAFDIFVLPSRFEGLPYVLLEAAWAGLPVIATQVGGISELIENNLTGRLIPPDDTDTLVRSLNEIMNDKKMRDGFGRALFDVMSSNPSFSKQGMSVEIKKIYQKLTENFEDDVTANII